MVGCSTVVWSWSTCASSWAARSRSLVLPRPTRRLLGVRRRVRCGLVPSWTTGRPDHTYALKTTRMDGMRNCLSPPLVVLLQPLCSGPCSRRDRHCTRANATRVYCPRVRRWTPPRPRTVMGMGRWVGAALRPAAAIFAFRDKRALMAHHSCGAFTARLCEPGVVCAAPERTKSPGTTLASITVR